MVDGVAQDLQHESVQAVDFRKALFVHHRDVAVRQEQHPVLEDEDAEGLHPELEVVGGGIVLGLLEHDGGEIVVVFDTGKLVGVECGGDGMFGNLVFLDQDAALFLAEGAHHHDVGGIFVGCDRQATGFDFVILEHRRPLLSNGGKYRKRG